MGDRQWERASEALIGFMYLSLVKQAVLEAWGESSHCVFTHCWEVFKHASLRDVTSLPSGFPGHTLSLSPRGFYVGICSGAGNRPKVNICLLVFQWLLTLIRERERAGKKQKEIPTAEGAFWYDTISAQTFEILMVIHRHI